MQALETLLSTQLAAWHNRHPLARHVRAQDVHTMGVVALPFMRSGPPREAQEPVLGEPGTESAAPSFTQPPRPGLLQRLLAWRPGGKASRERWPVFSEQFVVGVSAAQAGEFARRHGYSQRPDDGSWPLRNIPVDEALAAQGPVDGGGAWPEEIYVLSAAIDAGPGRTRVLVAQGAGLRLYIRGPRCLHPVKVGAFGLLMALLLGLVLLAGMGSKKTPARPDAPAPAAPAPASSAASSAANSPIAGMTAASAPMAAASASSPQAGEAGASSPGAVQPGEGQAPRPLLSASQLPDNMASAPDIRPHLVTRPEGSSPVPSREADSPRKSGVSPREPIQAAGKDAPKETRATDQIIERANSAGPSLRAPAVVRPAMKIERPPLRLSEGSRDSTAKDAPSAAAAASREAATAAETLSQRPAGKSRETGARTSGPDNAPLVALVGPVMGSKAEAEAYLQKMQPLIQPLVGRKQLEQQVLQTPEGWRAAVWPFASREEAQLINAMLVARGLRTRAVDF
ncbi:hypothetical protein [Pelomonas sp. BJYL3]|uniref:hypothetical protein n=1 Tax=Pelomonas sp. BJYL3 TaxID=2976697 RepID=UPI0022B466B1|nr:hypothetical protein [Pelomonas sp. BJYL3]